MCIPLGTSSKVFSWFPLSFGQEGVGGGGEVLLLNVNKCNNI